MKTRRNYRRAHTLVETLIAATLTVAVSVVSMFNLSSGNELLVPRSNADHGRIVRPTIGSRISR